MLSIDAIASRTIYTSKELSRRNPTYHDTLMRMRHLSLLYFFVEDMVRPFENAAALYHSDRFAFNEVTNEFIKKYMTLKILKKLIIRLLKASASTGFGLSIIAIIYFLFFTEEKISIMSILSCVVCLLISILLYYLGERMEDEHTSDH